MKKLILIIVIAFSKLNASDSCVVNTNATCIDFSNSYTTLFAKDYCNKMSGGDFRSKICPSGGVVFRCNLTNGNRELNINFYSERWNSSMSSSQCYRLQSLIVK